MSVERQPRLIIQADTVVLPGALRGPGFVVVEGGRIAGIEDGRHPRPHMGGIGQTLLPAFVDLQINGAGGCDFLAPTEARFSAANAYLRRTGTAAYLPTLISAPEEPLWAALEFFAAAMRRSDPPRIIGVHLEGPFLSHARPGAHRAEYLQPPSVRWITKLLDAFPGVIRLVTLAPELSGAGAVIDALASRGVLISAGHTDATFAQANAGFDRGVRLATHLFNAMRPYHHREPGAAGAALARPDVTCSVIADHVHVHPAVLDQIVALKGPGRVALVTDAISAAGAAGRTMTLGDRAVHVVDGAPRLDDGTLAGSVLAMDQAVRHIAARWGLEQAVQMAASTPARLLGLDSGEIRPGRRADLVLLDGGLTPTALVVDGVPHALGRG